MPMITTTISNSISVKPRRDHTAEVLAETFRELLPACPRIVVPSLLVGYKEATARGPPPFVCAFRPARSVLRNVADDHAVRRGAVADRHGAALRALGDRRV